MKSRKKCGIVTFHSAHNYGSVLQAYALTKFVSNLGFHAEIIDFRHKHTTEMYEWRLWSPYKSYLWNLKELVLRGIFQFGKKREYIFKKFINDILPLSSKIDCTNGIDSKYDFLICGSDQIWNPNASGENHPIYFLNIKSNAKKISYAASSGSVRFGDSDIKYYQNILKNLSAIGVREQFMKTYIENTFKLHAEVNPDPTFLLKKDDWEQIEQAYYGLPEKYVLLYTIQNPETVAKYAQQVGKELGIPVVQICNERGLKALRHRNIDFCLMDVAPQQFLWLFHHANFIVTNTFHGNIFSVIYRKNFIHYSINENDSRITTLHNTIGLNKTRYINSIELFKRIEKNIDYTKLEALIESYRQNGFFFLNEHLR